MRRDLMIWLALATLAACGGGGGGGKAGPSLDPAHLPAELKGLMPGVAGEADVLAALPGAKVSKDHRLSGAGIAELNEQPAINLEDEAAGVDVWLTSVNGQPRVARISAHVQDACVSALATLGDRAREGTCFESNRKYRKEEYQRCASTPDGKHQIAIECDATVKPNHVTMWLKINGTWDRSTRVIPADQM